jgi:aspartate-semialdehyde dehydrogenase
MPDLYKIAIVGASSLRGKELNEALAESPFVSADFVLMDEEEQIGQLEAVGDEVALIQRIEPESFRHADFVFFAGSEDATRKHWKSAHKAGASIVDLTGAMEQEAGVLLRAPWLQEAGEAPAEMPGLTTPAVVSANPAALALALLMQRTEQLGQVRCASATVLEPASEYGRAAMDELHQQTVNLLNFQSLPRMVYDTQVAFNATPVFGEAARTPLQASESRVRRHYSTLRAGKHPVMVQMAHAPVFHGYTLSLAIEMEQAVELEHLEAALQGEHIDLLMGDADAPTNLSSAGQSDVLVRLRTAEGLPEASRQFWLWVAFDNLRIASLNAVACAMELQRLRPKGKVQ